MLSVTPEELTVPKLHQLLLGSVGPRPICFASTIDSQGNRNLAPFSFFNVFSANPPILVFSPARSGRTNETKHTHDNVKEVPQVVINVVTYDMVHQMSLASSPYAKGVDEFVKTGFTPVDSDLVKPARVKESPVQLECEVQQVVELGQNGGAGNLVICKVLKMHIDENVLNEHGQIDQTKIDLVASMGGDWYCRAQGDALFELVKPLTNCGIGVDALPEHIRLSHVLSGNDLGRLGNVEEIPDADFMQAIKLEFSGSDVFQSAKRLLSEGKSKEALALLW
ncbi:MAG: flavin reductase family protein [Chitinophagaceae bacterium]